MKRVWHEENPTRAVPIWTTPLASVLFHQLFGNPTEAQPPENTNLLARPYIGWSNPCALPSRFRIASSSVSERAP